MEPTATSHGDPIIWTFDNECYDLNKDGLYIATKHPKYSHVVKIAVYNYYMREIQLYSNGKLKLSINNLGEVINHEWYGYSKTVKDCPDGLKDCMDKYIEYRFDAQDFRYSVQILRHDYLDPALKEGEFGYHLDIYPQHYSRFEKHREGYSGLYFENPLPDELEYCQGGSIQLPERLL